MSLYRIEWTESWLREKTVNLDEDSLRAFAEIPVGPIPVSLICTYLEESVCGEYDQWHPNTRPGSEQNDDFDGVTIDAVDGVAP